MYPGNLVQNGLSLKLDFGEGAPIPAQNLRAGMQAWYEGPIREAAVVYINDKRAGAVWCPPYSLDVTGMLRPGQNKIRIMVANTAMNYMAGHSLPDYRLLNLRYGERFQAQDMDKVQPIPSGLLGPIRLMTPVLACEFFAAPLKGAICIAPHRHKLAWSGQALTTEKEIEMKSKFTPASYLYCAIVFALMVFFVPVSLRAQEVRGKITGQVVDPNKAAVPGATVKVIDVARGATVTLTTNADGTFQAPYLLSGTYQVVIEVAGFKKYIQDGVLLQISENRELTIVLEVGGTQETVTVTAEAAILNSVRMPIWARPWIRSASRNCRWSMAILIR